MTKQCIPILADALRTYYTADELHEVHGLFDAQVEIDDARGEPSHLKIAKRLITEPEIGQNQKILEAILPSLFVRCSEMVAKTGWENREFHQEMSGRMERLRPLIGANQGLTEISVPDGNPFSAKSLIRELLATAKSPVLLVDAYVGIGTLDCFRHVDYPIRILTGDGARAIESGFDNAAREFRSEGRSLEVRRHAKLHDRYLAFNERCWLIGGSIKDAGKKQLNVIECVDIRASVIEDAEKKWSEAIPHP